MTIPTNLLDTWRDMYSLNLMDDGPPQRRDDESRWFT